jgi:hypothetical protein
VFFNTTTINNRVPQVQAYTILMSDAHDRCPDYIVHQSNQHGYQKDRSIPQGQPLPRKTTHAHGIHATDVSSTHTIPFPTSNENAIMVAWF